MNISLSQLRSLVELARQGSFTRAASALHRTQPSISAQIKELEGALGLKLVDRTTREVQLNTVGAELAPVISGILSDLDRVLETTQRLKDYQIGLISISCLPSFAASHLPAKIVEFRRNYPGVRFHVRDEGELAVVKSVASGEVEIGVTTTPTMSETVRAVDILDDPFEVVFPVGHALESVGKITLDELTKYDLILMAAGSGGLRRRLDAAFANQKRILVPRYEAVYFTTAMSLVRAGLGISLLTATINHRLDPDLRARRIELDGFSRRICLVTRLNRTLSPATQAFHDLLTQDGLS